MHSERKMTDDVVSDAAEDDHLLDQVYAYLISMKYPDDANE